MDKAKTLQRIYLVFKSFTVQLCALHCYFDKASFYFRLFFINGIERQHGYLFGDTFCTLRLKTYNQ